MAPCEVISITSCPSQINKSVLDSTPSRHPDLSFSDGNLAVLAGNKYFLVHQGLLCRHSPVLKAAVKDVTHMPRKVLEGCPVLEIHDQSEAVYYFLVALYDGISELPFSPETYPVIFALLQLSTKYQVHRLRNDLLRGLSVLWPRTLALWDTREENALNSSGLYEPRRFIPHPILVINLARSVNAPELLPSAFYDLSRISISCTAAGHVLPETQEHHHLSEDDLFCLLKGREEASRFFSTFLVSQLENRFPSVDCIHRQEGEIANRSSCRLAFESLIFKILHDAIDVISQRGSDPLFAIMDVGLMQTRDDGRLNGTLRPCECCQAEFRMEVEIAREEFWQALPEWFGIDIPFWG